MRFTVKDREVRVETSAIVLAALILGWAVYYCISTINEPDGGPRSVLFIKPLTIMLAVCFVFVVISAVKVAPAKAKETLPKEDPRPKDRGFLDHRRAFFAAALVAYAVAMTCFGYLIPSILYMFIVCYYLGVRQFWVLLAVPVVLSAFMSITFKTLMGVPIPIWPSW